MKDKFNVEGVSVDPSVPIGDMTTEELIVALYDVCLLEIGRAEEFHRQEELNRFNHHVYQTEAVILHLQDTIDLKSGGPTAKELFDLYSFCMAGLTSAKHTMAIEPLGKVKKVLEALREGLKEVIMSPDYDLAQKIRIANEYTDKQLSAGEERDLTEGETEQTELQESKGLPRDPGSPSLQ